MASDPTTHPAWESPLGERIKSRFGLKTHPADEVPGGLWEGALIVARQDIDADNHWPADEDHPGFAALVGDTASVVECDGLLWAALDQHWTIDHSAWARSLVEISR